MRHLLILTCLWTLFAGQAQGSESFIRTAPETLSRVEDLHRRAEHRIVGDDFRGALSVYTDILLIEPDDETAYVNMGRCYMILGDFDRAKDAFRNALAIDPDNELAAEGLTLILDPDGRASDESEPAPSIPAPEPGAELLHIPGILKAPEPAEVQQALKNAGLYDGAVDGQLGLKSREGIQRFQMRRGLLPDGIAGPKTWELLKRYLENRAEGEI